MKQEYEVFTDLEKACAYSGEKICVLSGDADFTNLKLTSLGKLTRIGGDAYFSNSKLDQESIEKLKNWGKA